MSNPPRRWLAADDGRGDLTVWDLDRGELRLRIPRPSPRTELAYVFHPSLDLLYLSAGNGLELWDVESGDRVSVLAAIRTAERMSFSPEGRFLAVAGTCRTGCGFFDLCVYGIDDGLFLAVATYENLLGAIPQELVDLVYSARHEVLLWTGSTSGDSVQLDRLSPASLRRVRHSEVAPGGEGVGFPVPGEETGIRSAPSARSAHLSPDGRWRVALSTERARLYLYRLGTAGEAQLEKFAPLP